MIVIENKYGACQLPPPLEEKTVNLSLYNVKEKNSAVSIGFGSIPPPKE
jgi:hypothetical protein